MSYVYLCAAVHTVHLMFSHAATVCYMYLEPLLEFVEEYEIRLIN